ncbi:MAG TPA: penicillin-binding protein 1A [Xanthobacteraceae bacterium]|jgi:penicillin-binding protein 1A|nr:penicillin-binding protein 1A [Xanthobacteraceae bacterium]
MSVGRTRARERREPVFEAAANPRVDLPENDDRPTRRPIAKSRSDKSRSEKSSSARARRGDSDARPRRPKRGRQGGGGNGRSGFGRLVYWGLVLGLWGLIGVAGTLAWVGAHLPPIQSLEIPKRPPSIQIVGLGGRVLTTRGDMGGAAVPLREMPAYLPKAFLAIEDRRFYSHHGVDPIGLVRAALANVLHRGVSQGGSTLTQQLAKNLFLTQERTLTRKLQEVLLAFWLEHKFTKTQILELYLNRVYFGSGAYGVEAAAQRYFGKSARHVTLAESALLAGLVKSPSRLAPTRNFDGAERRAQVVLSAMAAAGFITDVMAKTAMIAPPRIVKQTAGGSVNYVADWVMDVLNDLVGHFEQDIVVETSIDPVLQANAEKALIDELAQKGERFGVQQGALVAMTPDGAVRALVGGRSYAESQFNRAVSAKRQPGSAFKPFVYLTALEHGLTPGTVRDDKPIALKGWKPENYGREYFGPVTLTQALAHSLNTVSVRLTLEFGPAAVVRTAHRLGIASKLDPNPSIALGTSEVSVMEIVSAYAPFANGGFAIAPHVVERVRTATGKVLFVRSGATLGRVVEPAYVGMMNAMMRETLLSGTARHADLPGWPAAGKTGTSQDFRDAWFIGYTAHLVTGIWFGNDDSSPTRKATGGGLPVEVWSRFMKVAHQGVPVADLPGAPVASFAPPPAALPPANIPMSAAPAPTTTASASSKPVRPEAAAGLDGWLIDRLFGRR